MLCAAVCSSTDVAAESSCGAGEKTWNANADEEDDDDADDDDEETASSVRGGADEMVFCARGRLNPYRSCCMQAEEV